MHTNKSIEEKLKIASFIYRETNDCRLALGRAMDKEFKSPQVDGECVCFMVIKDQEAKRLFEKEYGTSLACEQKNCEMRIKNSILILERGS